MTKSKSTMFLAAFCLIVALAGVAPVSAQNPASTAVKTYPGVRTDAELLAALDNSIWIADGKPAEKQIYVIAAPWCGHTQMLWKHTRKLSSQVQFRWIEMDPKSPEDEDYLAEAATSQGANALIQMYGDAVAHPPMQKHRCGIMQFDITREWNWRSLLWSMIWDTGVTAIQH